jgi:hypothetical protein
VRLGADGLAADDVFHFVLERTPSVDVLLVEGASTSDDRGLYVRRALEIGDRPSFDITARRASQLTAADFAGKKVAILNDAGLPPGDGGRRLESFVRAGAGLIVALGETSGPRAWGASPLLPGTVGEAVDRLGEKGAVLGFLDHSHPALAIFGASRSGDLSSARIYRYRPLATDSGVMARFDDGSAALAEHRVGRGRVIIWTSSFDALWNDLPRQPVFLPFLHQLTQYAAAYRARRNVYEVGEAVDLVPDAAPRLSTDTAATSRTAGAFVALSPAGNRIRVGGEGGVPALLPREAGMYEVRRAGSPGERPRLVAVNPAARELEFARFDPTRLTNAVAPAPGPATADAESDEGTDVAAQEREQSLWWYLLLIVTGLLVGELLIADRISRSRPAAG